MAQLNSLLVTGDSRFLNRIKTGGITTSNTINQIITGTGTAATSSGTTYYPAKWTFNVGTAVDGDIVTIKIPVAGHDYGVFMSIDGGTTYYPIVCNSTGRLTTHYPVNNYITVVFEPGGSAASMFPLAGGSSRVTVTGGVWRVINYYDSNSNDTGYYLRRIYNNLKAGSNKIFPYTMIMQLPDGRYESIVTSSSIETSKARNTHGFRLGQVLLMYANATYNENAVVGTYNIWSMHSGLIDHRYSFNTANNSTSGTTGYKPVYIVGTLNASDGLFYLDTTWWTQTLPAAGAGTEGKIYIYIGDAYDYYRLTFIDTQKIYIYSNGKVREFAQDAMTVGGKSLPTSASSHTTGISIADHTTGSITGVQASTTTASKVTLGTAISVPNVTNVSDVTVPIKNTSATSIPNVTAVGSGSFTATVTNGVLSFSHTHTAPTLGTAISLIGVQATTTTASKITLGTAISVPNVTGATDVTVPIKNTSATTVVTGKTHTVTDNGHTHNLS